MAMRLPRLPGNAIVDTAIADHVLATYTTLRWGLGLLALTFPVLLVAWGWWHGIGMQSSLSGYYFAAASADRCIWFPARGVFVGVLCAISAGLYLYKGFTPLENVLLNVAAICGVVVAWVPERLDATQVAACPILQPVLSDQPLAALHWGAAIGLFLCLGAVAWFCADKTLASMPQPHQARVPAFRRTYQALAVLMVAGPLLAVLVVRMVSARYTVITLEAVGIWVFAAYWLVKSVELGLSGATKQATVGRLGAQALKA